MTQRTTEAERDRERDDDDRNAGCVPDALGCGGEGCLLGAVEASSVVALVWFLS